jgi:hypothetical protein
MNPLATYTAAHYAAILGVTSQAVRARLAGVPAAGRVAVRGIEADAWPFDQLPARLAQDLGDAWKAAAAATGAQPWRDLAHFLSDPPPPSKRTPAAAPRPVRGAAWKAEDFAPVESALARLSAERTPGEVAMVWQAVFEAFETALAAGREERRFKRALIQWLNREAPFLAGSRRTFNRDLAEWRANGRTVTALVDNRTAANTARKRVRVLPAEDLERLVSCAIRCHWAQVAPAWDELLTRTPEQGGFSAAMRVHFQGPIPESIQKHAGALARARMDFVLQPRKAGNSAAYSDRDWSDVAAGDWFTADDFTLEVYFYIPDGAGWYTLTRGQVLLLHDERSKKILGLILIPEKGFGAGDFRSLARKVCLERNCPRKGFKVENGLVFRKAALFAGAVPWGEVVTSLATRLGITVEHTQPGNHKGKLPECVGKAFQARLRRYPGWCGPDEMGYPIEALKSAKAKVEAGEGTRKAPWEVGFQSMEEWFTVLQTEMDAYNRTEQASKVMGGRGVAVTMTPNEAWKELNSLEPMTNLRGSGAEHLLTHHWRMVKVTRHGIRFQLGKEAYAYSGTATGAAIGQEVKFYFDQEAAEVAFFETADGKLHTVERQRLMPAHGASDDDWAHRGNTVVAHNKAIAAKVAIAPTDFMPAARANVLSPDTARRGAEMQRGRAELTGRQRAEREEVTRARGLARKHGLPEPATGREAGLAEMAARIMEGEADEN